ncbi:MULTISPECIES: DUF7511 domain-containing protein [Haloarcula]|uniref:DUF7511 domain-containing protein n=1 Tax=Haloarcula TaxID=2237 RepID=UPI0023E870D1|nr:hypothetical protein [Halomicroarcula sp. SHR3]
MSSESPPSDIETRPPLPQDEFSEALLTSELEPTADGGQRALLYPDDRPDVEKATHWLAVPEGLLVDLGDIR